MKDQHPKNLLQFPKLLANLAWQLFYFTFTEVETFLLALVAVLCGFHFGVLWGVTVFFSLYLVVRMIGGYVSLLASKLHMIALVLREKASDE